MPSAESVPDGSGSGANGRGGNNASGSGGRGRAYRPGGGRSGQPGRGGSQSGDSQLGGGIVVTREEDHPAGFSANAPPRRSSASETVSGV